MIAICLNGNLLLPPDEVDVLSSVVTVTVPVLVEPPLIFVLMVYWLPVFSTVL